MAREAVFLVLVAAISGSGCAFLPEPLGEQPRETASIFPRRPAEKAIKTTILPPAAPPPAGGRSDHTCRPSSRREEILQRRAEAAQEAELYRSQVELPALAGYRAMTARFAPRVQAAAAEVGAFHRRLQDDIAYFRTTYPDAGVHDRLMDLEPLLGDATGFASRLPDGAAALRRGTACLGALLERGGDPGSRLWAELSTCHEEARGALQARRLWLQEIAGARQILEEEGASLLAELDARRRDPRRSAAQRRKDDAAHRRVAQVFQGIYRRSLARAADSLRDSAWDLLRQDEKDKTAGLRGAASERASSFGALAGVLQVLPLPRVPEQAALERIVLRVLERMGECLDQLLRLEFNSPADDKAAALADGAERSVRARRDLVNVVALLDALARLASAGSRTQASCRDDGAPGPSAGLAAGAPLE